jgi:SRSO17 transposase
VPNRESAPSKQKQRFAAYLESLALAANHLDRAEPLKAYCRGLLLPLERKSVEPMAARLAPHNVRQTHQWLHHLVAASPWDDDAVQAAVRRHALTAMTAKSPVAAWIVDDTGLPKKGKHSVGVTRQYCGQLGKQENCQVAVSLSVSTPEASLPVAWRLYLPESWAGDIERRRKAGVPDEIRFQTKQKIALEQIREALAAGIAAGVVLADAAYGNDSGFREELEELGLEYAVGVQGSMTVWRPGEGPLAAEPYQGRGRPPKLLRRDAGRQPLTLKQLAAELPRETFRSVSWRGGTKQRLRSRFALLRVRPAHRDYCRDEPHAEQWLLIEWPPNEAEPTHYWLANLPASTKLKDLVAITKQRWVIERDYQELKQELGLGHYEGRGWRGFHYHATLCIAAYGFLVAERARFSPSARVGALRLSVPKPPAGLRPRGAPHPSRAA